MDGKRIDRVLSMKIEYERLLYKVQELTAIAEKCTAVLSNDPKGNSGKLKDDTYATLLDYKAQCEWQVKLYLEESQLLDSELDCIRNNSVRTAMKLYYIEGIKQEEIAERMYIEERSVRRLLQSGRKIYEQYYPDIP